jgi:hypothetical protein
MRFDNTAAGQRSGGPTAVIRWSREEMGESTGCRHSRRAWRLTCYDNTRGAPTVTKPTRLKSVNNQAVETSETMPAWEKL